MRSIHLVNRLSFSLGIRRVISSQSGQMAIFIALIFQILFVFFAMVINVGLVVHHKINLQNSVDLAAYYAAQRQAEMLNVIAHSNYQIRQAWKLLAWRYRLIGDQGRQSHPSRYTSRQFPESGFYPNQGEPSPSVCVGVSNWKDTGPDQNLCDRPKNLMAIPKIPNIAPFLVFTGQLTSFGARMGEIQATDCRNIGMKSWELATRWLSGYRYEVANRKSVLRQVAHVLSDSQDDFLDIEGNPVRRGMEKTLRHNLTRALSSDIKINFFNSLGGTSRRADGRPYPVWLNELQVVPVLYYTDGEVLSGGGCRIRGKPLLIVGANDYLPSAYATLKDRYDPTGLLRQSVNEPGRGSEIFRSTLGYEKNPWYMAYVGVKAEVEISLPFSPFGKKIKLVAKSFAKPFGGTIGPWYYSSWLPEGTGSSGLDEQKTDPLLPPLVRDPDNISTEGWGVTSQPNYSRFPGDKLGLNSLKALSWLSSTLTLPGRSFSLSRSFWAFLPQAILENSGDSLAWSNDGQRVGDREVENINRSGNLGPWVRSFEIAAVAPDLFDITYYSVETNFNLNYVQKMRGAPRWQGIGVRPDLGARFPERPTYSVLEQMETLLDGNYDKLNNYFSIKDWRNLLTAWVPRGYQEYDVSPFPKQFATCGKPGEFLKPSSQAVPGMCARGGRAGYSVKIISLDYLKREQNIGNSSTAPLRNGPPDW